MKAVITVLGKDRVGIIAKISGVLAKEGINILDISQTIMLDLFTMIMAVDTTNSKSKFDEIVFSLNELGKSMGLEIKMQHEDIFNSMHRI